MRAAGIRIWSSFISFFINDIVIDVNACIELFADDTNLYVIVKTQISQRLLEYRHRKKKSINGLRDGLFDLILNKQTRIMLLLRKSARHDSFTPLQMNNFDLQEVFSHKHLVFISLMTVLGMTILRISSFN